MLWQARSLNGSRAKRWTKEGRKEGANANVVDPSFNTKVEARNATETCHSLIHRVANSLARVKIRLFCRAAVAENNYAMWKGGRMVGRSLRSVALIGLECDGLSCTR